MVESAQQMPESRQPLKRKVATNAEVLTMKFVNLIATQVAEPRKHEVDIEITMLSSLEAEL